MSVPTLAPVGRPRGERSVPAAVLALVRWPNAVIASIGVVVGAWWARPDAFVTRDLALAIGAAWMVTAAVNALNDAMDVEIDRVAHPDRPLPRGELSPVAALRIGVGATLLAYGFARAASTTTGMLVLGALLAAYGYAMSFSRHVLLGNVVVAVVASLPFVVGAAAAGDAGAGLVLLGVGVPLHLAREVMKDLADAAGDAGHRRTVPLAWGTAAARGIALAAVAGYAALVTFLFAPAGSRRLALLPSVALAAWATAFAGTRRAPLLLKLAMLLAMAALPLLR